MKDQNILFEKMARERNITVEEMKNIISDRIRAGLNDPDPEKCKQWKRIPCAGEMPTPEEWLNYAIARLREEGGGSEMCL